MVAAAGLTPTPWSARACAGWPRASGEGERGLAQAGTGRWGSRALLGSGSTLVGGWGVARVRERERVRSW
jgi:hypothetical protein